MNGLVGLAFAFGKEADAFFLQCDSGFMKPKWRLFTKYIDLEVARNVHIFVEGDPPYWRALEIHSETLPSQKDGKHWFLVGKNHNVLYGSNYSDRIAENPFSWHHIKDVPAELIASKTGLRQVREYCRLMPIFPELQKQADIAKGDMAVVWKERNGYRGWNYWCIYRDVDGFIRTWVRY